VNKLLLAATATAFFVTPLAHAQAGSFEGLSIGLGVTSADTTTAYVHGGSLSSTHTDNNAVFQLQYNSAVNDMLLVGLGLSANASDLKAGSLGTNQYKIRDAYSLYVAPGFAFNRDWMGYAKLAYLNANLRDSQGHSYNFDNGWGYGLGVQAQFGKNWFGQLEYMVDQYNDRAPAPSDTLKLKSNIYTLTAGYKF
jgi:opacity protein-like surface antigen